MNSLSLLSPDIHYCHRRDLLFGLTRSFSPLHAFTPISLRFLRHMCVCYTRALQVGFISRNSVIIYVVSFVSLPDPPPPHLHQVSSLFGHLIHVVHWNVDTFSIFSRCFNKRCRNLPGSFFIVYLTIFSQLQTILWRAVTGFLPITSYEERGARLVSYCPRIYNRHRWRPLKRTITSVRAETQNHSFPERK
jgi:hypothetical protein